MIEAKNTYFENDSPSDLALLPREQHLVDDIKERNHRPRAERHWSSWKVADDNFEVDDE